MCSVLTNPQAKKRCVVKGRKRVYIDWTYYQPGNANPIAAFFTKDDSDYISYVREEDAKKDIAAWKLAAETRKKSYTEITRCLAKRRKEGKRNGKRS